MGTKLYRSITLSRSAIDEESRTVSLAFSSETPVNRGDYDEVLSHLPNEMDMSRVNDAAVLLNHNHQDQVGAVVKAWNDGQKGRAVVKISKSKRGNEVWQDITDGILKHVSVGYEILRSLSKKALADGRELVRFAWRPYEISLVSVPADPACGIGRSKPFITMENEQNETHLTREERRQSLSADWRRTHIQAGVDAVCENLKHDPEAVARIRDMGCRAMLTGQSPQDFNAELLKALPGVRKVNEFHRAEANIGMSDRDVNQYSITRAIAGIIKDGRLSGLELEAHRAYEAKFGTTAEGFFVPFDVLAPRTAQRDMTVGTFGQGGAFVQTTIATTPIEILRNKMCTQRLGVQSMTGLVGNVAIPRQTGAATAYSLPETGTLTKATQAIDQIVLTPHRVGAFNDYSKQLLLQSSIDVENFMRDDLMKVVSIKWDKLVLEGSGSGSEPTGILNTAGIGTVTFSGAPTYAKTVEFETALSQSNADLGRMAFIVSPGVRGKWKTTTQVASSTFPIWIWQKGDFNDGSNDGLVGEYRASSTNQISSDRVAFGNWTDCIMVMWGGFDFVIDPYTLATNAEVRITVNTFGDVAIRHSASFAWSTDAGNQN